MRSFASDNNSGVHPLVMEALNRANQNHAVGTVTILGRRKPSVKSRRHLQLIVNRFLFLMEQVAMQ